MQPFIIGTAGHVDHGKTALIRALTGEETDRLKEEQERGMSIELGFAQFVLPSGRRAGVIDVPGHERFLKNMLAGAASIDLVLLVIAADEGVMPQTREHLDILHLLRTRRGLIVLTKSDLVDEEWLELVSDDVRAAVKGTFLADAPLLAVSAHSGHGMPELVRALEAAAEKMETRPTSGAWRLSVDRAFTIGGFGTVVTGTLLSGTIRLEDRVEVLPAGRETRVRALQTHGESAREVVAGSRVAVNLGGLPLEEVHRGDVLAPPGAFPVTTAFDARLEMLPDTDVTLKHRTRVRVYLGTAEVFARVMLLDREALEPGQNGLVQFRLETPAVAARLDRFVVRLYSPPITLGGGTVIDPSAQRHRRFVPEVIEGLRLREQGTPLESLAQALLARGFVPATADVAAALAGVPKVEAEALMEEGVERGVLARTRAGIVHAEVLARLRAALLAELDEFHRKQPMRPGLAREELRSRLSRRIGPKEFPLLLEAVEADGSVVVEGARVRRADFQPAFTSEHASFAQRARAALLEAPAAPPSFEEVVAQNGLPEATARAVWDALIESGELVRVAEGVVLHRDAVARIVQQVRDYFQTEATMTASQFRDLIGSTRKYAVPLLEYLDSQRVTRRRGDERVIY
jgi:selenocysteine-specific elongation factor